MDILGIGPLELLLVLVLALLVLGPDRLPDIGAKLGKAMRDMRRATREFSEEIEQTRQALENPLNELKQPFQEIAKPFQEVSTAAKSLGQAAKVMSNPGKALKESVMRELQSDEKPTDEIAPAESPVESAPAPSDIPAAVQADASKTDGNTPNPEPTVAPPRSAIAAELADSAPPSESVPATSQTSESTG